MAQCSESLTITAVPGSAAATAWIVDHRYDDVVAATTAMTALHGTEPATPHLALRARVRSLTVDDVERALYDERTLIKPMAMRRTLFVVPRELVPAVAGSAGRRVADAERRRLAKETGELERELGAHWIATAAHEIVDRLAGRGAVGTRSSARSCRTSGGRSRRRRGRSGRPTCRR